MAIDNNALAGNRANLLLKTVARGSAWLLLVGIVILVLSGWGITQTGVIYSFTAGLVDRKIADAIHRAANVPLALFFLLHVLINIKLKFSQTTRARVWLTNIILILIGVGLMAVTISMEYFRPGG